MARTINEIANSIKVAFVRSATLRTAYELTDYNADADEAELVNYYNTNISAVSVTTCMIFIVAACAATVENMMDWFTEDVSTMIDNERYGHRGWYENKAKAFQYQDGDGTDYVLNMDSGNYDVEDEDARIVKHASCINNNVHGVTLKVAKGAVGSLSPLTTDEKTAFEAYINRIKPAGIPVNVISRNADRLSVDMSCYYDPLIYNATTALTKIKAVITEYLQAIDFNGEFVTMRMVDRLQAVPGLDIIEVHSVTAKHEGYDYESIENDARYIPQPGYMTLGDDDNLFIELIPNL